MADAQAGNELGEEGDEETGCYVTQEHCAGRPGKMEGTFRVGDRQAHKREEGCLDWATRAHMKCRNPSNVSTTAEFRTTGASSVYPSRPTESFVRKRNRLLFDGDQELPLLPLGSVHECASRCLTTPQCLSFSYYTRGLQKGNCSLAYQNQLTLSRFEWSVASASHPPAASFVVFQV